MKAITQQWLDLARSDLRSCENNKDDDFVTNVVAFHSQQAVEKAFKALLEDKGIPVPRVHNLIRLHSFSEKFYEIFGFKISIKKDQSLFGYEKNCQTDKPAGIYTYSFSLRINQH